MIITHYGGQCFKVSVGDTTLAFDPISKQSKLKPVKFGADIVLISANQPDCNGVEQVTYGGQIPFVINGPGEYEVGNVTARGFGRSVPKDGHLGLITLYQVKMENLNLLFLGSLNEVDLDPTMTSEIGEPDILFVPVGGGEGLEAPEAAGLAVKLGAKLIIPMNYNQASLKVFLKECGSEGVATSDKLTIKKKDLDERSGEVTVLNF